MDKKILGEIFDSIKVDEKTDSHILGVLHGKNNYKPPLYTKKIIVATASFALVIGIAISLNFLFQTSFLFQASSLSQTSSLSQASDVKLNNDFTVFIQSIDLKNKRIINQKYATGSLPNYQELKDLNKVSTYIVRCIINKVDFISYHGMPLTKIDVTISESLKGTLKINDKISVVKLGGYVPLSEEIKYFHDGDRFSSLTQKQIDNTILEMRPTKEPDPKIGEEWVYFLHQSSKDSPAGTYTSSGDYFGRYKFTDSSNLARYSPNSYCYSISYETMKNEIYNLNK